MAKGYLLTLDNNSGGGFVPQWIKVTKTFTDFATAGLTNDIEIYPSIGGTIVHEVIMNPTTTFSGGGILTYTISVGKAGLLDTYLIATTVFTGASIVTGSPAIANSLGSTGVRAAAISTGANLDQATQGSVDFYLLVSQLP